MSDKKHKPIGKSLNDSWVGSSAQDRTTFSHKIIDLLSSDRNITIDEGLDILCRCAASLIHTSIDHDKRPAFIQAWLDRIAFYIDIMDKKNPATQN